jgi:hypothetical protein
MQRQEEGQKEGEGKRQGEGVLMAFIYGKWMGPKELEYYRNRREQREASLPEYPENGSTISINEIKRIFDQARWEEDAVANLFERMGEIEAE